jgi:hypothetical protein
MLARESSGSKNVIKWFEPKNREAPLSFFFGIDLAPQEWKMVLEMSEGPTGGEISDISEALLDHFVKIAYPVGML